MKLVSLRIFYLANKGLFKQLKIIKIVDPTLTPSIKNIGKELCKSTSQPSLGPS